MKTTALLVASTILLSGCATERGNARHAQHAADQVRIVAVQREAMVQEAKAEASTQLALMEALARVAEANPQEASSVAVALAVIGARSSQQDKSNAPVIGLQKQSNDALEWTKALAPTVGNLVSGLGVAAINASVTKNAQNANRDIMIGDQQQNARIVESVAGLGRVAVDNAGMSVGGSYYDLEGEASVDQSTNSSVSTVTETITETSTNTTTTNETSSDTTITTEISANTTIDYQGEEMTLAELVTQLQNAGATYSVDLNNDGEADVSGGDGEVDTDVSCVPTFEGYQCTGE